MTALVILAAFIWLGWSSYTQYRYILEQEYRTLEISARQREARLSGALRSVDLMLQQVGEDWIATRNPVSRVTPAILLERMRQLPEVRSLIVVDQAGRVAASSLDGVLGFDVTDRSYFRDHRNEDAKHAHFHVSRPFKTRTTQLFVITVSRALRGADGRFLGVVVATLDPKVFEDILRIQGLDADSQSLLVNRDGDIISIAPASLQNLIGGNLQGGPAFTQHLASGQVLTRHLNRTKHVPIERAMIFLDVPQTELMVVMSRNYQSIIAVWWKFLLTQTLGFLCVAAVALFLAALAVRRQRRIEQANQFSHKLIETANALVLGLDEQGRVSIFNAAAEQLTGHPREEMMGQPWFETVVPRARFPQAWQEFQRLQTCDEVTSQFDHPILRKDGEVRLIAWQNTRLNDQSHGVSLLCFGRDITRQQAEADALRQSQAEVERLSGWMALLLNSAGDGIYVVDQKGLCSFVNPSALSMLGVAESELLARDPHALFHRHQACAEAPDCPVAHTLRDQVTRRQEDLFVRKNGEVFPVQLVVTPMFEAGQLVGAVVVFQDISERKRMEGELVKLATTDVLTGLANRRHFVQALDLELARLQRQPDADVALLMLDLDYFKQINDTYGHAGGDAVLRVFADCLRAPLRKVDLVSRLGGEEFAMLLPGTHPDNARLLAERLRQRIGEMTIAFGEHRISVAVSIGVAALSAHDASPDDALGRADKALYAAKHGGRNRVAVWSADAGPTEH